MSTEEWKEDIEFTSVLSKNIPPTLESIDKSGKRDKAWVPVEFEKFEKMSKKYGQLDFDLLVKDKIIFPSRDD